MLTFYPSRIQGSKSHPIPDPDPQHCLNSLLRIPDGKKFESGIRDGKIWIRDKHPVFRICDVLIRTRIRGSVVLDNWSGSCSFFQWPSIKNKFFSEFLVLLPAVGTVFKDNTLINHITEVSGSLDPYLEITDRISGSVVQDYGSTDPNFLENLRIQNTDFFSIFLTCWNYENMLPCHRSFLSPRQLQHHSEVGICCQCSCEQ